MFIYLKYKSGTFISNNNLINMREQKMTPAIIQEVLKEQISTQTDYQQKIEEILNEYMR